MTEKRYKKKLSKIKEDNKQIVYKINLDNEKKKYKKAKIETNKKIAIYLFVMLNAIVIYCMVAMWHFGNLDALPILISDIAAQILLYGIYCLKAYSAKKSEENMKYKREKLYGVGQIIEAGSKLYKETEAPEQTVE